MAALPYMQLYVADYLADAAHLSTTGHGAYLLLIMNYWQRGEPLPDNDRKLARIVGLTEAEWLDLREDIAEFFTVADGEWRHKRIELELAHVRVKSTKASESGKRSAAKRSKPSKTVVPEETASAEPNGSDISTNVQRTFNECSTDVDRSFNHTDTDTDTERLLDSESVLGSAHTREPESRERQIVEFDFMARSRFVPELFEPDELFHVTHRHRNPAANYHVELERFKAHEFTTPKSDWQRAWISWWLRAKPDNTHDTRNSLERQTDELLGVDRRYL